MLRPAKRSNLLIIYPCFLFDSDRRLDATKRVRRRPTFLARHVSSAGSSRFRYKQKTGNGEGKGSWVVRMVRKSSVMCRIVCFPGCWARTCSSLRKARIDHWCSRERQKKNRRTERTEKEKGRRENSSGLNTLAEKITTTVLCSVMQDTATITSGLGTETRTSRQVNL